MNAMSAFTGVGPLVRFVLRRDRVYLPVWVLSLVVLTYVSAAAVRRTYDTPVEIASYAVNMGTSPASIAMGGPPVALREIGGILIYETSLTVLLGVALMAVFTVVRHTRKEEDAGRVELLGSTVVSPHAVITAAVLVAAGASVLVGAGVTWSFLVEQQPVRESVLFGAAVAAMGIVFTGVGACAAQVMSHGRGAVGLSLAFLGVAFGLRAIGDVGENAWSWLSPMGWSQQVRVYDDNRWWPLALSLVLTAALLVGTVLFEGRRDLGAGIVPSRPGPPSAGRTLAGVVGLAWRLQRGAVVGWVVGIWSMGLLLGSFSESIQNMIEDNPTLAEYLQRAGVTNIVDSFFATSLLLLGIGASGFAVASALRTRSEESAGRVEPLLATGVSRARWLFGTLLVTLGGTTLVVASGGLGVGMSYALTTGRSSEMWRMTGYALVYLPAVLLLAALVVLLVGWLPRASGAVWVAVALCFVVGWLGSLLELPQWAADLSPFTHVPAVPAVPADDLALGPVLTMLALAVAALAAGWVGFRRRDIG
ncbi:ABC transporter permease [Nocardioides sp. WL0053]|uniref:ABC transporter permease n=1 Tax=Nocardioides jiangsuensis TaxID=2866161 RepID=A0ABS7RJB2_9ACTN|nr:ABC transporter permease [Nocardioides jiangsuensis]MBY9075106.1 ABC transporter permease [Nocardioides jiangsuensis]